MGRSPRVGPMALHNRQPLPPSPLVTYNRQTTETSFFKPSTHEMVHMGHTDEGLSSTLTTQLDARRISRMQNYLNNQD